MHPISHKERWVQSVSGENYPVSLVQSETGYCEQIFSPFLLGLCFLQLLPNFLATCGKPLKFSFITKSNCFYTFSTVKALVILKSFLLITLLHYFDFVYQKLKIPADQALCARPDTGFPEGLTQMLQTLALLLTLLIGRLFLLSMILYQNWIVSSLHC